MATWIYDDYYKLFGKSQEEAEVSENRETVSCRHKKKAAYKSEQLFHAQTLAKLGPNLNTEKGGRYEIPHQV